MSSPIIINTDGGTEAMRVDPSGNVGIHTATPTNPLHVNSNEGIRQNRLHMSGGDGWSSLSYNAYHNDANTDWVFPDSSHEAVTIEMDDAGGTPRFQVWNTTPGDPTGWVQRFAIDGNSGNVLMGQSGGNVGIGTTSPNNQLVLAAQASFGGNTSNTGSEPIEVQGPGAGVSFYDRTGGSTGRWVIYSDRTGGAGTETLRFWSAGDKVAITQGGNVGIGTTSPNNQLVLAAQASFGGNTSNTGSEPIEVQGSGAGVSFYDRTGGSTGRWVIYSDRTGEAGTETLRFWSAGDKVAITQGGNVGIGLTEPRTQLHALGRIASGLDFESAGSITFFPPDGFAWFHIDNGPAGGRGIGTMRFSYGVNPGDNVVMAIDQQNNVSISGTLLVTGPKQFVQDHPTDPTRQIVYVSLEGGEAGTYTRGTWKLDDGKAVIELPEHFGLVTSEDGLSVQLTPRGEWLQLYVVQLTTRQVIVQEAQGKSGQFDYLIQGVRKGYEHHEVIQRKE